MMFGIHSMAIFSILLMMARDVTTNNLNVYVSQHSRYSVDILRGVVGVVVFWSVVFSDAVTCDATTPCVGKYSTFHCWYSVLIHSMINCWWWWHCSVDDDGDIFGIRVTDNDNNDIERKSVRWQAKRRRLWYSILDRRWQLCDGKSDRQAEKGESIMVVILILFSVDNSRWWYWRK